MRIYETTFILSPQADDAAFDRQIKSVTDLITSFKGRVLDEDRWGIRRLSYAIKKFTQGYYACIVFEGNGTLLSELDRFFRIEEPYIRYLTVLFEGKLETKAGDEKAADLKLKPEPVVEPDKSSEPETEKSIPKPDEKPPLDTVETEQPPEQKKDDL